MRTNFRQPNIIASREARLNNPESRAIIPHRTCVCAHTSRSLYGIDCRMAHLFAHFYIHIYSEEQSTINDDLMNLYMVSISHLRI